MPSAEEIVDVRPRHRFDESALVAYLRPRLEGFDGSVVVRQFEGGQSNPTFFITADGREYVLRKKPPGDLLPSAHMVEREYRVMKALRDTDVPVPKMHLLCEDPAIIGTPFFVMEYVQGRLFEEPTFPGVSKDERAALFEEMARLLASLHSVDHRAVGLETFGKPGNYYARQIGRWTKQYRSSKTDEVESMERLMEWLPSNIPDDSTSSIVHGDVRPHNVIFHPDEPRALAVLDWELSTVGHPLADVSYNCIPYHQGSPRLSDADAPPGIPTEREYLDSYCRKVGRSELPGWPFYLAFSLFRSASIIQGVYKRGLDGNASSSRALEKGRYVREIADVGWAIASRS